MFDVKFIDRAREIEALRNWCSHQRYTPLYIYGPEGCGKTRLLKEFVKIFEDYFGEGSIALYIDAMERHSVDQAIFSSKSVELVRDVILAITERFVGYVGRVLANSISTLLEKAIINKRLEDNYIFVAVDDVVRVIGLNQIEWYVKWLFETMNKLSEIYRPRAINFIVTTSEGVSLELISRHRHVHPVLLWNLDKDSFESLFYELKPPSNTKFEDIWYLFGGNPGKLIELSKDLNWNVEEMLKLYRDRISKIVIEIISAGLSNELELVINDITILDKIHKDPELSKRLIKLAEILIDKNLLIYKKWTTITRGEIKSQLDIGIGEYYAWQVPMYRDIMKKILTELSNA